MAFVLGVFVMITAIIVGYLGAGGNLGAISQPFEWIIIIGAGLGTFIMANSKSVTLGTMKKLKYLVRGSPCNKRDYLDLLTFLFLFLKKIRALNFAELEKAVEFPAKAPLISDFPNIDIRIITFICDFLRMLALGVDDIQELDDIMETALEERIWDTKRIADALSALGASLPGLGIVAAVLGVILAMGVIDEAATVLGLQIASALVGTLAGVGLAYCVILPMASLAKSFAEEEAKFFRCVKVAIITYAAGSAPYIAVEFARQAIPTEFQPEFHDFEKAINSYNTLKMM